MKTKISISVLLIILITSLITVMGQEKTDKKKQEEDAQKKKEQATIIIDSKKEGNIDSEKEWQKALDESLATQERALKEKQRAGLIDNKTYLKETFELQKQKEKLDEMNVHKDALDAVTNFTFAPSIRWKMNDNGTSNAYELLGDRSNTSLSISKTLEDVTIATDFYYDLKEESSNITFYVSGTMKAGELKITLKKPDKTAFQEITISPLADVNWNQQFHWNEEESDQYLGKWTISIAAEKANGNYRVQVNSR